MIHLQEKKQKMRVFKIITVFSLFTILFGCVSTQSSIIISGNLRPETSPDRVRIYIDPPARYETIGIVNATSEIGIERQAMQAAQDRTINELIKRAAKMGANGIILSNTKNESGETIGFYSNGFFYAGSSEKITAQGRAIYVIRE